MQNLLDYFFFPLCAVSYRLSLDDIPAKETVQFTISPTLTWAVLHNRNKPRILPAWHWEALKDNTRVNWQPKDISTDFHSFCLYTFHIIRVGKVLPSFPMSCKNRWYALKQPAFLGVVMLKSRVLQIPLASPWQVDCLMLLASVFTSLLPRQSQAKRRKVGGDSGSSYSPQSSLASWTWFMGMEIWRKPRKRAGE